jgi:hypothetical protein
MIRRFLPVFVCAAAAWADSAWPNGLTVTFNGGTALEIHTESTLANSPLSTSGSVAISDRNEVSRTVVDKQGRMLFTYDIEATPEGGSSARYTIRIKPHDPNRVNLSYFTFAAGDQVAVGDAVYTVRADGKIAVDRVGEVMAAGLSPDRLATALRDRLKEHVNVSVKSARRDVPTVAAVREFKGVKIGEGVSIDILHNPSTGERIFDVIQPLSPGPRGVQTAREAPKLEDEFSLMKARIAINGKTVEEPGNNWMIGGALKIALPGHGTVYLAVSPVTSHAFQAVGRAEKGKLSFPIGPDFVEITSPENIMKKSAYRTIWVYWDPNAPNTETVDITCSGTIESLLPKK